jgi:hypothetical protein
MAQAREGLQAGALQKALRNSVASLAKASMCGLATVSGRVHH